MTDDFGKVAVLLGGDSAERKVSLVSGQGVLNALLAAGVDAHPFDPSEQAISDLSGFDRAFIALHGGDGENGVIQGILNWMGLPYTGPGVMASAIGMDKWRTKLIWQAAGLPVPESVILTPQMTEADFAAIEAQLGLPLFVKPAREGSSVGIVKVHEAGQLHAAWQAAAKYDSLVLAERALLGGEYTVAILGREALPIIKIEPAGDFYDYEAKYLRDDTRYLCPADLPEALAARIRQEALQAFEILGGSGWGRVDFLMDEAGRHYFLEVNTAPGMTPHSLVPMAAAATGLSYGALVLEILRLARSE
ncbi:MAG: D-alanine--D-alanine ligase [Zoogloeaceae bacterium]|nr:D-alanine--D-alanine ligase [Zoogloeaceae bacterium]